jgi:hypothetical protein
MCSNQPCFYVAEKVFGVGLGFFGGGWIVAVLKYDFLQRNLRRILWFEAACDQFSGARGEAFGIRNYGWLTMRPTIVILELGGSEAVISALGFLIGKQ